MLVTTPAKKCQDILRENIYSHRPKGAPQADPSGVRWAGLLCCRLDSRLAPFPLRVVGGRVADPFPFPPKKASPRTPSASVACIRCHGSLQFSQTKEEASPELAGSWLPLCTIHLRARVDASPWGIGGTLVQQGKPIRWFAYKIHPTICAVSRLTSGTLPSTRRGKL